MIWFWKLRFKLYKAIKWVALRLAPKEVRELLYLFDRLDAERLEIAMSNGYSKCCGAPIIGPMIRYKEDGEIEYVERRCSACSGKP